MVKVIDLSVPLTTKAKHLKNVKIEYIDHKTNMKIRGPQLGLKESDFPEWGYCAVENLSLNSHDGTHLDAPWHYSPVTEGKPSKTIDQIPLDWCYGNGVVLDFHHFKREQPIQIDDLKEALQRISYQLKPFDIVLIRTDATKHWLEEGYRELGAGLTAESTEWLIDQGIRVMGIDSWTLDQPFDVMLKRSRPERFLESHKLGHKKEYCHVESLVNLDKIPEPFGFKVAAFPIKIEGGSGSWTRAVAIFEE